MKNFIETVSEAAWQNGNPGLSAFIKLNLEQEHLDLLQEAADIYSKQSNSHKHSVSGSVCNGCKFDKKCNMQDNGRYKEICSHFKQTDR